LLRVHRTFADAIGDKIDRPVVKHAQVAIFVFYETLRG
jgi:hypothetical protein